MINSKSITVEQLRDINSDLANTMLILGNRLTSNTTNHKSSFWIDVEKVANHMYITANNGHDISESVEVSRSNAINIENLILKDCV